MADCDQSADPQKPNPQSAVKAWRIFGTYLDKAGLRVTKPRRIVCEHAFRRSDHFTAEMLAAELGAAGPERVSRGTVYHTLALLVRAGLLREIRVKGREVHYDRTLGFEDHEHLVCEQCGCFSGFLDPVIHRRIEAACRKAGFTQRAHRLTVLGICRKCREEG